MLQEVKQFLLDELDVIKEAPATFVMAFLVMAIVIVFFVNLAYRTRLENKQSQIDLQEAQVADYRRMLDGASPDEAKARIESLQAQVNQLAKDVAPRVLSTGQAESIASVVSAFQGRRIDVQRDMSTPDSHRLAKQFLRVFQQSGWNASDTMVMGVSYAPATGLGVLVGNPSALSQPEHGVVAALRAAKFPFDVLQRQPQPMESGEYDVVLLITSLATTAAGS